MVQRPVVRRVTEVPATEQTAGVDDVKLTARPELAVAPTVMGESARILSARVPKVMTWSALLMAKVRCTGAAAL